MRRQIERLLGSEISAYAIAKKSGVPYSTISDLRTGKRTLDGLSLANAEKLVNYIKLEEKKMRGWGKLGKLFIDEDSMAEFMNRYFDMYETDIEDIDLFGWDAVADDIEYAINNYGAYKNVGDFVEVEISRNNTKNGNPELITVGEVVESPNYDSETDQWYGDYKLKN